jgi:hypothetical protein
MKQSAFDSPALFSHTKRKASPITPSVTAYGSKEDDEIQTIE